MKIFAVINNYRDSAGHEQSDSLGWYELPDSSILRTGNPFFVPDFDPEFRLFPSLCLRIGRLGKGIAERFAHRYIDAWTLAGSVVAMKRLESLRAAGLPWTRAVAFDRSCLLGNLQPIETLKEYGTLLTECGDVTAEYNPASLIHSSDALVSMISEDNTLKTGDLILAGLASHGIKLTPGQRLTMKTDNNLTLIALNIK